MTRFDNLVKSLRYCATHDCCGEGEREAGCAAPYSQRKDCDTCNQVLQAKAADAIDELCVELRTCRNELCLKCGDYKLAHKGACDGCRWKDLGD